VINLKKPSVLITGGSGMIGTCLTRSLLHDGYSVSHLSRSKISQIAGVQVFSWDPEKGILDAEVFAGVDHIIHLAGANIGEKRWTQKRRDEIRRSRIDSAKLIHKVISENGLKIKTFISASGISIYGTVTTEKIFTEEDPPAGDFLGNICIGWEAAADLFAKENIRTVKIRQAVVLGKNDLALKRITFPSKFGFLGQAGKTTQYMPWIHLKDICNIYLKALKDERINGVYNAVSPEHVTHHQFMKILSKVLKKPLIPVPLPEFVLKIVYGEMAGIVLEGSRVSSEKIRNAGYTFEFDNPQAALENIYPASSP
jgi:uncharacterized protein (TIGR01777 family)